MDKNSINRINELARKKRTTGLTPAEAEEQIQLRKQYIEAIRADIKSSLDNVTLVNPDGSHTSLKEEHDAKMAAKETSASLNNSNSDANTPVSEEKKHNPDANSAVSKEKKHNPDANSPVSEEKEHNSDINAPVSENKSQSSPAVDASAASDSQIPENEPDRQFFFMEKCSEWVKKNEQRLGRKLTFHTSTFGCQMNFKDSEKLGGVLEKIGFVEEETENADFVIYNTCTVRENANSRVYGRLGYVGKLKKKHNSMIIAMCGCMMQEPHIVEKIKTSYSFVDIIFGTHNIYKLAELLYEYLVSNNRLSNLSASASNKLIETSNVTDRSANPSPENTDTNSVKIHEKQKHRMIIDIWKDTDKIVEELPSKLKASFKAGINIMFGCNNFCSYCIVPYVRGRERSRKPEDIINEIKQFVNNGVVEIMLLGQNVNSYGKNLDEPVTFAELLKKIDDIEGLERIRFMTSHPKDLSDELIDVMKNSKRICHHIHLPVQSGSSRLLKLMNRKYTKEDYLLLIEKLKTAMPDIAITTDIIVGFPGETEADFEETLDVCKKAGYSSAFTFIYSKRTGTPAASMPDQIDEETIKNRFDRLLSVVNEESAAYASGLTGKIMKVLVEERDRESEGNGKYLTGRLENNLLVHFEGEDCLIGKIVNVKLTECKGFYFIGELESDSL